MKKLLSIFVIVTFGVSTFCQSITTHFGDVKVKGNIVVQNLPWNTYETESTIPYLNSSRIHFGDYYFKQVADSVWLEKPLNTWTAPITKKASATSAGYLSKVDWNTFNGKANPYTFDEGLTLTGSTITLGDAAMTGNLQLMWPSANLLLHANYTTRSWTFAAKNVDESSLLLSSASFALSITGVGESSSIEYSKSRLLNKVYGTGGKFSMIDQLFNSITVSSDYADFAGLQYAADYSTDYSDRSLIDKGYADANYAGYGSETDPVFTAWDKSTGVSITESQISDFGTYLTTESDPVYTANAPSTYAAIGNGVTNGDSHNHYGGDGGTLDHTNLDNIGTTTHADIDLHIGDASNPHGTTLVQSVINNASGTIVNTSVTQIGVISDYTMYILTFTGENTGYGSAFWGYGMCYVTSVYNTYNSTLECKIIPLYTEDYADQVNVTVSGTALRLQSSQANATRPLRWSLIRLY